MNRFRLMVTLAAAGGALACVVSVSAAPLITMSIEYNTSYDANFNPKGPELNARHSPHPGFPFASSLPTDIHQFDVFMTITGLPAGDDLQTVVFDAALGPGVTPWSGGAYVGDFPFYDPPPNTSSCPSGCLPLYNANQDAGPDGNDLRAIVVISDYANNFQGTHLRHPGELEGLSPDDGDNFNLAPPTFLGSIFVNWNGTFGSDKKSFVALSDPKNVLNVWSSVSSANQATEYQAKAMDQGPRSEWLAVPEPTSALLLFGGFAGLLLIGTRRV